MEFDWSFASIFAFGGETLWVTEVFVVVFTVLLLGLIQRLVFRFIHRRLEITENPWDDAFVDAIQRPLTYLIWMLGITFAAEIAGKNTESTLFELIEPVRYIAVIGLIVWSLLRFARFAEDIIIADNLAESPDFDQTTINAIGRLLRASLIITAALVVMQTLGFSISGVLAFGGIGGIAVGFAARDVLANFFGGLMIYMDRPFGVGDWVRSPDREIEGTVEYIGWRHTRIRTFDKRPMYIPNAIFSTIAVENPSRMTNRRIYENIGLRYDDVGCISVILADVERMLRNHPDIETSHTLMVNLNKFAPSSLEFFIYTFTKTTVWQEFHDIKQGVLLKIADIIEKNGAEIAFPTTTVHAPDFVYTRQRVDEASPNDSQ